ncbi:aldo/keto reductase [Paraburkholderia caballeronis]|uniref:Aldo/keto reductase family protein n=1 Tax=Paraburkholderia caballeronis TaxID=416943 RepID=A0A1H7T0L7_9BURK|nr:aldo/keto reductase [Paraburkholderia caballeronis]PXW25726.1 aldo/keto reductase family protein [Paraburkholderia caballeronis]PXX01333.1 aldo/keto reductase family protein [Paraburkholderia caballeronis]RAJ99313.1 aldo/keto reductase family protein [Paraburkholderia caballeronis]SEL77337.1 Aldo/keto reductase family protein [Paraburkholderia caballeronis]
MDDFVASGKVRYLGVSGLPAWKAAQAQTIAHFRGYAPMIAMQVEYSLFERGVERDGVRDAVRELRIGSVSYSPLGRAFLSGKLDDIDTLAPTDFRRFDPRFQDGNIRVNLRIIERIAQIVQIAHAKQVTPSQLAIAWTIEAGAVPIPGTRRVKYLEENVAAANIVLTRAERRALDEAASFGAAAGDRYAAAMRATLGH